MSKLSVALLLLVAVSITSSFELTGQVFSYTITVAFGTTKKFDDQEGKLKITLKSSNTVIKLPLSAE